MHCKLLYALNILGYILLFANLWIENFFLFLIGLVFLLTSIVCSRGPNMNCSKHNDSHDFDYHSRKDKSDIVFLILYTICFLYKCYH